MICAGLHYRGCGFDETTGGSMRIADIEELLEGYEREGIDPAPYYWCD